MKQFRLQLQGLGLLLLFSFLGSLSQGANALELPSLKKDDNWQYRKYIREMWYVPVSTYSEANLNRLLSQNYPDSDVSWRDMILATYVANQITTEARKAARPTDEKLIEFAMGLLIKQGKSYAAGKIQGKLKIKPPAELSFSAVALLGFYNAMLTFAKTVEQTKLNMQLQRYFVARDSGVTKEAVAKGKAGNVEFDPDPDGGFWIITVDDRNALRVGAPPFELQPNQVWEIGELLYQAKKNPQGFDDEKKKVGAKLFEALRGQLVRVGYLINKKLMIVGAEDFSLHYANEAEKQNWQSQFAEGSTKSPDGEYQVEGLEDNRWTVSDSSNQRKGKVKRIDNDETILDETEIEDIIDIHSVDLGSDPSYFYFGGWMPDSKNLVFVEEEGNAGGTKEFRCIINVESQTIIRFNGWASRDMKVGIVPNVEGRAFHRTVSNKTGVNVSDLDFYAVRLPQNIEDYKASLVRFTRKKLILDGKPFRMSLLRDVQFSSDSKWALCEAYKLVRTSAEYYDYDGHYTTYLISLQDGKVRELQGKQAKFLSADN
jgi:hypothetical protein